MDEKKIEKLLIESWDPEPGLSLEIRISEIPQPARVWWKNPNLAWAAAAAATLLFGSISQSIQTERIQAIHQQPSNQINLTLEQLVQARQNQMNLLMNGGGTQ